MAQITVQEAVDLALQHFHGGELQGTESLCQQILQSQPTNPDALHMLGLVALQLHRYELAEQLFRRAILSAPRNAEFFSHLGHALAGRGENDAAAASFRQAIAIQPDLAEAHNGLGILLRITNCLNASLASHQRACSFSPNSAIFLNDLACTQMALLQIAPAAQSLKRALQLQPRFPSAELNLACAELMLGDFEAGWKHYEARREVAGPGKFVIPPTRPMWDGSDLQGKRILVHAEQGLGDTVQLLRYLPLIARRGGKIVLAVQQELHQLCRQVKGIESLLTQGDVTSDFDVHCPLPSVPRIFGTTLPNIPPGVPYLHADPQRADFWKQKLADGGPGLKVGLVWSGRSTPDPHRSMRLTNMAPLAQCHDARFYSLQKGAASAQIYRAPAGMPIRDLSGDLSDIAETAAIIANLDLVISIDTMVAHLAGAMGKPVWVMLPFLPDWRWHLERSDSPWYPTMRLFRQAHPREWDAPVEQAAAALMRMHA